MMRAPRHWFTPPESPGLLALALSPLGAIYAAATKRRIRKTGFRATVPVICIGNLNAGGTGKTPTTIALIERLTGIGLAPHVVSRGFGGKLQGPVAVDGQHHSAADVGDEPLLLAAFAPTWVSQDRAAGVRAAQVAGARAILLDDGFQNPSVQKDLSIVVVDAWRGFGNGLCIPAGPLREPIAIGLARADFVLSIGSPDAQVQFDRVWGHALRVPHLTGRLAVLEMGIDWHKQRLLAFAGIAHPEKFFETLRGQGADLVGTRALDDHQPLSDALLSRLAADARALDAQLVTTEKDAVRLPSSFRTDVLTLPVRLRLDDWTLLDAAMQKLGLI